MTDLEAFFFREMANCERAWNDGSVTALAAAIRLSDQFAKPLPGWTRDAILRVLAGESATKSKRRGRLARAKTAEQQNSIHYERWDAVTELRERKKELAASGFEPTWEAAYENASTVLAGTTAAGSPDAIKKSYQLVERLFRSGEGARFYIPPR